MKSKAIFFYLLMLLAHIAHVFEEVWAGFWILRRIGLAGFLAVNWVLFSIPLAVLYFILHRKRWAFQIGLVYAGFMGLQGFGHNIATIVTGRYFDGYAGGFSGIAMIIISWPLVHHLRKEMPPANSPADDGESAFGREP
jgi:hypothetical protein